MFKCQSREMLIADWERNNYSVGDSVSVHTSISFNIKLPKITININTNGNENKPEMIRAMKRL